MRKLAGALAASMMLVSCDQQHTPSAQSSNIFGSDGSSDIESYESQSNELPLDLFQKPRDEQDRIFKEWISQFDDYQLVEVYDNMQSSQNMNMILLGSNKLEHLGRDRFDRLCRIAQSDCAEAGDIDQCMEIRHKSWRTAIVMSQCYP